MFLIWVTGKWLVEQGYFHRVTFGYCPLSNCIYLCVKHKQYIKFTFHTGNSYLCLELIMTTTSNGIFIRITGPLCGEFTSHWWILLRPVTRSFDFSLIRAWINLSKQSWGWWFETPSRSLWRHCNDQMMPRHICSMRKSDYIGMIFTRFVFITNTKLSNLHYRVTVSLAWMGWYFNLYSINKLSKSGILTGLF